MAPFDGALRPKVAVSKRGIAQLLWRCPVCHTNRALLQKKPLFRAENVGCLACGTRWKIEHVYEHDFRLEVIEGAPDLVGLNMALTMWYDEMKRGFQPQPIAASGVKLAPGEHVVLEARGIQMVPHQPNPLFEGEWSDREAPLDQESDKPHLGEWDSLGEGRLILTNRRMIWQGADRELDFHWSRVTAIYLWLRNTLGIMYGTARYRIKLGTEVGLEWLTYSGALAQEAERETGYELTLSPY